MPFIRIVALSIAAAVLYGIAHDLVTAHWCVEYFTFGHPPLVRTASPVLLALAWGVMATWWLGLLLGIVLACAARLGPWPGLAARQLVVPVCVVLLSAGLAATLFGWRGTVKAGSGSARLPPRLAVALPPERHAPFVGAWFAHTASYAVAGLGGFTIGLWALKKRHALARNY